jgi:four helix bundle protein
MAHDRLETPGVRQLAAQLLNDYWVDSELVSRDYRGRESLKQQIRSLDSACANVEAGYGRGFSPEMPQHLEIARESRGSYDRMKHLLPSATIVRRIAVLDRIIGGLTNSIIAIEKKQDTARG